MKWWRVKFLTCGRGFTCSFFASKICCTDVQINIKNEILIALTYLAVYVYLKLFFSPLFFSSLRWLVSGSLTDFCHSAMLILFQEDHICLFQKAYLERCSYLLSSLSIFVGEKNAATGNWKPSVCLWRRQCNTKESRREHFLYFIYHFASKCCFLNSQIR